MPAAMVQERDAAPDFMAEIVAINLRCGRGASDGEIVKVTPTTITGDDGSTTHVAIGTVERHREKQTIHVNLETMNYDVTRYKITPGEMPLKQVTETG